MSGFVYMWINKVNNKKYVGSHIGAEDDGYTGSGTLFKRAVVKHGIENFERIILEHVEKKEDVQLREEYYLKLFNVANDRSFYNLRDVAGGGFEYINNNPEVKENANRLLSIAAKKRLADKNKHPRGMAGKKHKPENIEKITKGIVAYVDSIKKPVLQYDLAGNLVAEHESICSAAKAMRGSPSNIKYTIEGKFKKAYKHTWKYKE
jgi:group I intron endonuclease